MKLSFTASQETFRTEISEWLETRLSGEFSDIRGVTSQTAAAQRRILWEQELGRAVMPVTWCQAVTGTKMLEHRNA